jgi:Holliday junction resolvase-like predicted endonuclease
MVNAEKARRVRRAAEAWLAIHHESRGLRVRFDVIAVRAGRLEHVPDAF